MNSPKRLPLAKVQVKHFKAIRETGSLPLGSLSVFIGNNGSGKSSIIEAMETVQRLALENLDEAWAPFGGYEHARYKGEVRPRPRARGERLLSGSAVQFTFQGNDGRASYSAALSIQERENNELFFSEERVNRGRDVWQRDAHGSITRQRQGGHIRGEEPLPILPQESLLKRSLADFVGQWQFVRLNPDAMGRPTLMQRSGREIRLAPDGSNIAQYLWSLREESPESFDGLIDAMREVLPYATDLQPQITRELERNVYLRLIEQKFEVLGWMLSTGTLRVLALLALFRHPRAPPLVFIEELENGLDPRTLALIVSEIRSAVISGRQQVIATTHSPYLLDLLDLRHLILVERVEGTPVFYRPGDDAELSNWASEFASPGTLYTRGELGRRGRRR
jgi:predicted ATPase